MLSHFKAACRALVILSFDFLSYLQGFCKVNVVISVSQSKTARRTRQKVLDKREEPRISSLEHRDWHLFWNFKGLALAHCKNLWFWEKLTYIFRESGCVSDLGEILFIKSYFPVRGLEVLRIFLEVITLEVANLFWLKLHVSLPT